MTRFEPEPGTQERRVYDALEELQGGRFHLAPLTRTAVADHLADVLLPQHRRDVLNAAIEVARGEYLEDATGTPEDEAYNRAISDVVAAIGAFLEAAK
ncbi:hypothetical protein [Streptomyces sp. NPDC008150]|uniref:hypothetical protein n=1 Tax=Streptomyces sp. NPDC008150 TaxID=3364816 RepID=UPI0036E4F804